MAGSSANATLPSSVLTTGKLYIPAGATWIAATCVADRSIDGASAALEAAAGGGAGAPSDVRAHAASPARQATSAAAAAPKTSDLGRQKSI
jgi:hypothetical protein